jgi:hypothetical protein
MSTLTKRMAKQGYCGRIQTATTKENGGGTMNKKRKSEEYRGPWKVRMRITREYIVTCDDCTEAEARERTFSHSINEQDVDTIDWEVLKVEREER